MSASLPLAKGLDDAINPRRGLLDRLEARLMADAPFVAALENVPAHAARAGWADAERAARSACLGALCRAVAAAVRARLGAPLAAPGARVLHTTHGRDSTRDA